MEKDTETKSKAKTTSALKTKKTAVVKEPKIKKVKTVAKKVATLAPTEQKLRIRVRAYEHTILDLSVKQIIDTATRFEATIVGPVPLPTEIKRWTVNRSTFVHKDAREQFEMRIHKRLIDIMSPSPKVVEALTNLNLPSGVTIDVKMV